MINKLFNITYSEGTPVLRSVNLEADSMITALNKFGKVEKVIACVEVCPIEETKAITILANKTDMTLLTKGVKEKIVEFTETQVITESNSYDLNIVKCVR